METLKPGTRCECQSVGNRCHDGGGYGDAYCQADAVRLVSVAYGVSGFSPFMSPLTEQVPMCAACADFHERGGK